MKSDRVNRMLHLLSFCQSGRKFQSDEITKLLKISKRTFYRDIEEFRKIGIKCNYNREKSSYEIVPESMLPETNLTIKEAQVLLMLVHEAKNYINFPFKASGLMAALKIERSLRTGVKQHCHALLQNCSIRPQPQAQMNLLDTAINILQEAITKKHIVTFNYRKDDMEDVRVRIHPYHLFYAHHSWHIIGKLGLQGKISAFKLHEIKDLTVTKCRFTDGDNFDLTEYMGMAWSIRPEGLLYNIKLSFLPEISQEVVAVQWHSTQTVTMKDDGSAILEFRVDGLNEIIWWIVGYGHRVKVLSPRILKKRFADIAQRMLSSSDHNIRTSDQRIINYVKEII